MISYVRKKAAGGGCGGGQGEVGLGGAQRLGGVEMGAEGVGGMVWRGVCAG